MGKAAILYLLAAILLLSACSQTGHFTNSEVDTWSPHDPVEIEIFDTDVVDTHGRIQNKHLLDEFVRAVAEKTEKTQRIIRYTIEGDPIIYTLHTENGAIRNKIDASHDQYGGDGVHFETFSDMFSRKVEREGLDYIEYVVIMENNEYIFLSAVID